MEAEVQKIWEGEIPFNTPEDARRQEGWLEDPPSDGCYRVTNVSVPTLTFKPASGPGVRPAVLVLPGGGYTHLAWSHEGLDIASMLNINGISAFILRYRCPRRRKEAHADAARAMRFIRANAERFSIDPAKVGVIGFSAGAHLAATLSAPAESVPYPAQDAVDAQEYRPDFAALVYPAYLVSDEKLTIAPEFKITSKVPSTLLIQAEDDGINVENALGWYLALKRAGVPAEMHLYSAGGHGYGLRRTGDPVSDWGTLAGVWFRRQAGLL